MTSIPTGLQIFIYYHSVHPHPAPCLLGEVVEPPTKFSKRRGLTGSPFLEGSCRERGGNLFQWGRGVEIFKQKINKSGIFNDKKSL